MLLVATLPAQAATELFNGQQVSAGEVIVKLRSVPPSTISRIKSSNDIDTDTGLGGIRARLFHSRSKSVAALVRDLSADPNVVYAEPNYIIHPAAVPNDPKFGQQYGLQNTGQTIQGVVGKVGADISAVPAWDITTGSTANVVAVVDSGIQYTNQDLVANMWSAPTDFTVTIGGVPITCPAGSHGFDAIINSCDPNDDYGHGTLVTDVIGAVGNNGFATTGVNWTASLMGARFYGANGAGGTVALAINAIEFTIQAKQFFAATSGANVRVLNNSWSFASFSQALLDEINSAGNNDILFVAAADNFGLDLDVNPRYPAAYNAPNLISVAATDNLDDMPSWSDYGPTTVHLGAAGVNVLGLFAGTFTYGTGTSFSAPYVAGAAALALSVCPLATADLRADILNTVDPIPSLAGLTVTGGRLNAYRALLDCIGLPTPTATPTPTIGTPAPCPQNDLGSALPVSVSGTTAGGTNSVEGASCGLGGDDAPDVTYQWTAPGSGTYVIDTFGSAYDTLLYVRDTDCSGAELGCDDDASGTLQSQVTITVAAGQTILIVVDGYGSASGSYNLHINAQPRPTPTQTGTRTQTPTSSATATATQTPAAASTSTATQAATSTAAATPTDTPGQAPTPTATLVLIPGGTSAVECVLEWYTDPPPSPSSRGLPVSRLDCTDDDPSCDFGAATGDNACTFHVGLCVNVTDPRIACTPTDVERLQILIPNEATPRDAMQAADRDALEQAIGGLGALIRGTCSNIGPKRGQLCVTASDCDTSPGSGDGNCRGRFAVFSPALTSTNSCTGYASITVPLRNSAGRLLAGRQALRVRANTSSTTGHKSDIDLLTLVCHPHG